MKSLEKICLFILILSLTSAHAMPLKNDKISILVIGLEMSNMRNMLAAYISIGAKVHYKNPKKTLQSGIIHYEDLLHSLEKKYPDDATIQNSIQLSLDGWKNVKHAMQLALQDTSLEKMKKGAIFIHGNIRTVIKELAHMKEYLLSKSHISHKKELDASIEIAASARRLSAHYMMDLWKLDDPTIKEHWEKGLKIYGDSLVILQHSSYTHNYKFNKLLKSCVRYYKYFIEMGHKPKVFPKLIEKKANIVFNQAKTMTEIILEN